MHSHSDLLLLEDGNAQSKIRQGVTTEVLGEGTPPDRSRASSRRDQCRVRRPSGRDPDAGRLLRRGRTRGHLGQRRVLRRPGQRLGMRHGRFVRAAGAGAVGEDEGTGRRSDARRRVRPVDGADDAAGFAGHDRRFVELCKVVREHGGIYSTHIRNEGPGVFDAVKEAIADRRARRRAGRHHPSEDRRPEILGADERGRRADRGRAPARRERAGQCLSLHARQQQSRRASSRRGPTKAAAEAARRGSRTRSSASG